MSKNDVFHVIGLTSEEILSGTGFRILSLGEYIMKDKMQLNSRFGPLVRAIKKGLLIEEEGEVLFLSRVGDYEGANEYARQYDEKYQELEFFNDVAYRLCQQYGIPLPPVLKVITRAELPAPRHLGVSMRFRHVRPNGARAAGF